MSTRRQCLHSMHLQNLYRILFHTAPLRQTTCNGIFPPLKRTHFTFIVFQLCSFFITAKIHYFDDHLSETQVQSIISTEIANNSASVTVCVKMGCVRDKRPTCLWHRLGHHSHWPLLATTNPRKQAHFRWCVCFSGVDSPFCRVTASSRYQGTALRHWDSGR